MYYSLFSYLLLCCVLVCSPQSLSIILWFLPGDVHRRFFFSKQKTSYALRIRDWSSDVCSSDLFGRTDRRRPRQAARAELFPIFAPFPHGLEEALAAEMQALGFDDAQPARAGCRFHADWTGVLRANLYSRLATRILVQVAHGPVRPEDDILELAQATPWERWFGAEQTLRVRSAERRVGKECVRTCRTR